MEYLKRCIDSQLQSYLRAFGAVLIEGPKWCGKTTTAEQQAKSVIWLQDPDMRKEYLATAETKPSLLLLGETPRLIDEWQDAPVLWDAVRVAVDQRRAKGQFILTGSNSIDSSKIAHTGTGRISRLKMYPMSLYESKESTGGISLAELFDHPDLDIDGQKSEMSVEDLIQAACRGGWPAALDTENPDDQLLTAIDYLNTVCDEDISRIDGVQRNPNTARLIIRSYARNLSTLAKKTTILQDIIAAEESVSMVTFDEYIGILEKLFVIKDIAAWSPAIRSATVIRSGPKRGFTDPSIAVAALGLAPKALYTQLKTFGFIFESMCIRDLRSYSLALHGNISYYHDRYGLEADAVLHLADGRYALIECKLGSAEIEEGATHLLEMKRLVTEHNKQEKQVPIRIPDLLIVLTGGRMAYTRNDGVKIIPLGCLKD